MSSSDFDRLFQTHCTFVWRCLGALGVRGPDVEDLAQEVFVIVHRRLPDLDLDQGVRPWLYGILRRVVLNYRRSQRRRPTGHSPLDEDMGATTGDQHLTLEAREAATIITHVLRTMPEEQAEVFLLVDLEQFSVTEVGATLDIPSKYRTQSSSTGPCALSDCSRQEERRVTKTEPPVPTEEHSPAPELEAHERAFLEQARAGLSPSDEAVRKLRARIDGALPRATTDAGSRSPSLRGGYSRNLGTGLFGLGLGLGTVLGYWWGQHDATPVALTPLTLSADAAPSSLATTPERAQAGPTPGPKPGSNASPLDASTPRGFEPGARRSSVPRRVNKPKTAVAAGDGSEGRALPTHPPQTSSTAEADEILLVQRVQRALARKEPGLALGLLNELDVKVPKGRLREERAAGRAIALCMQHSPRANSAFETFKRQFPTSVHLPRAAAACGAKETTNDTASSDGSDLPEQE